jgi:hypothetical protein
MDIDSQAKLSRTMEEIFLGSDRAYNLELEFKPESVPKKTLVCSMKTAMRLKYINGGILDSIPFRYIRSKYTSRHLLPSTLSPVYTIPTLESDTLLFVVQFSRPFFKQIAREARSSPYPT